MILNSIIKTRTTRSLLILSLFALCLFWTFANHFCATFLCYIDDFVPDLPAGKQRAIVLWSKLFKFQFSAVPFYYTSQKRATREKERERRTVKKRCTFEISNFCCSANRQQCIRVVPLGNIFALLFSVSYSFFNFLAITIATDIIDHDVCSWTLCLAIFVKLLYIFTQKGNARRLPPQANIQLTNKNSLTHLRSHTRAETLIQYKTNSTYIHKPIRCTYDTTFANFMLHLIFVTFVAVFCMFTSHHSNEYFVFVYHSAISSTLRCQNFMYDFSLWRTANLWSLFILLNFRILFLLKIALGSWFI